MAANIRASEVEVWRLDGDGGSLIRVAPATDGEPLVEALDNSPARRHVIVTGEAGQIRVNDPDVDQTELDRLRDRGFRSLLLMPLVVDGTTRGLLACYASRGRSWGRGTVERARATSESMSRALLSASRLEA
jgi:GAF domain-containing protein